MKKQLIALVAVAAFVAAPAAFAGEDCAKNAKACTAKTEKVSSVKACASKTAEVKSEKAACCAGKRVAFKGSKGAQLLVMR